jgi:hypothetical protein
MFFPKLHEELPILQNASLELLIKVCFLPHYYMIFNGENVSVHVKLDIKWIKLLLVNCHQNVSHPITKVKFTFLGALPSFLPTTLTRKTLKIFIALRK